MGKDILSNYTNAHYFYTMRCIIGLYCFLFAIQQVNAQVNSGITYLPGKLLLHTPKIYIQDPGYSQAIEFSYRKQTLGKNLGINAMVTQKFP